MLKGKKALFLGDSIVMASGYRFEGWPYRIKNSYAMTVCKNKGVDGASLSTCRGQNLVYNHMMNNYASDKTQYDFVVLEGGVNDAWDFYALDGRPACPVGDVVNATAEETDIDALDRSTMAGGMEHLIYNAKKLYPSATIIFVFNFQLRKGSPGRCGDMDEYIEVQKKICDKWGIPYCNLYEDAELNRKLMVKYSTAAGCVPDGIHPNDKGYDLIAPIIAQSMADAYVKAHA
ncbi:MAG: SGNH/GDSL hydrolase family protein [Clostridia bacterium]|nr:SGNH/GDSL hydrolase family protein [Clostridia bacterium]